MRSARRAPHEPPFPSERGVTALTRPKAVLFDWDNTLVDSWAVIHAALNETLTAMDHPNWTRAET